MQLLCVYLPNRTIDQRATSRAWKAKVDTSGHFQREIASRMNLTDSYFSELLKGKKNWTEALAFKLDKALGGKR